MITEQSERARLETSRGGDRDAASPVDAMLSRHPVVGAAVGVLSDGVWAFHGHGVADIAAAVPIDEETVFRVASITKTFTAIAVMQLWEEEKLELDAPANDYLRSFRLIPSEPGLGQPTVRHLLTHTAGLGELAHLSGMFRPDFGESVATGEPMPTLAEFYGEGPIVHAEPGSRFVYGNQSPATLGQLVEDVTDMPLSEYFAEYVFEPLGMTESNLLRTQPIKSRLATGYEIGRKQIRRIDERDMVTAGAASVYSTPRDMARYLEALIGGGVNEFGTLLRPETLNEMFAPQYQPDPRIPGMGLGFFRYRVGEHIAVGHQGSHPGFHSQILAVPEGRCAVMVFTNGSSHPDLWLPAEASNLIAHALGTRPQSERRETPHEPGRWDDLVGWYKLSAGWSDIRLRGMMGAGAEVTIRNGTLTIRFLTPVPALARGFRLLPDDPDDPYVFRIDLSEPGLDSMRVVFGQDSSGATRRLFLDMMPLTLDKRRASTNPRRWFGGAAAAGAAAALLGRRMSARR